jgi:serine/threonine protein kinase
MEALRLEIYFLVFLTTFVMFASAWTAPELLNGAKPTPSSDVYSFGIMLYEVIATPACMIFLPPERPASFSDLLTIQLPTSCLCTLVRTTNTARKMADGCNSHMIYGSCNRLF